MAKREIRFSGFGGQGVILAGYVLGKAATIYDGREAVFTQNYGPASRGGACRADVVVSDEPVDYPKVTDPDVMVVMSQEAYATYAAQRSSDCLLLIDEDLVTANNGEGRIRCIPATRIAEGLGRRIVANMVMLASWRPTGMPSAPMLCGMPSRRRCQREQRSSTWKHSSTGMRTPRSEASRQKWPQCLAALCRDERLC